MPATTRGLPGRLPAAVVIAGLVLAATCARRPPIVLVHVLAFNDFHGSLDPPAGANGRLGGVPAGGIEYLSTHLAQLKARDGHAVVVSAGDNIGASQLISGFFHDESTIEALNQAGLELSAVGNHELDEGWVELRRMARGGCHPADGCQDGTPFDGARFQYLAANVRVDPARASADELARAGLTGASELFPPMAVRTVGGVKVGFIGATLRGAATLVMPAGVRPLTFEEEADAANRAAAGLAAQGVHAIVLLLHQGGAQSPGGAEDVNGCENFSGPIAQIAERLSADISAVVGGHVHRGYNCRIAGKLVTGAASFGRAITDITLGIDRSTGRVASASATNVIVTRDVPKDPAETAILDRYRPFYTAQAQRVVGTIGADLARRPNASGESPLGDLIADALLAAARRAAGPEVAVAFMNASGIRADLGLNGRGAPAPVTFEAAYTAQPFGNDLVVKTLTGELIARTLELQFASDPAADGLLQVSAGFSYRYDRSKPDGRRVDRMSIRIGGRRLDPAQPYRVAMNSFLASGGDGFTTFTEGADAVLCGTDLDALVAYLAERSPVSLPAGGRITRVDRAPR
jgi:5'-nucleotidase